MICRDIVFYKQFSKPSRLPIERHSTTVGEVLAPPALQTIIKPLSEKEECAYLDAGGAIRHKASSKLSYYAVRFPPLRFDGIVARIAVNKIATV